MATGVLSKFKAAQGLLSSKYRLELNDILNLRKILHMSPEIAFQETKTKEILTTELNFRGFHTFKHFAETGFTCDISGLLPSSGPKMTIGLRADMDGLQIQEKNTFTHASVYPCSAHLTGHDGNMAALIGTADILIRNRKKFPSNKTVRLIFQPAQETCEGAKIMVSEGALEGVDEAYAMYHAPIPYGTFGIRKEGVVCPRVAAFYIDIQGKKAHGASPEKGHDPIAALWQTYSGINSILSRGINRMEYAVCTICQVNSGVAPNIIPDTATMAGSIRTHKLEVEDEIKRQITNHATRTPKGLGCEGKVQYVTIGPEGINAKKQAGEIRGVIEDLFGEEALSEEILGRNDDFSFMSQKVPGAMILVGNSIEGKEIPYLSPFSDYNDDLLAPSVLAWVKLIERRFNILLEERALQ